MRHMHQHVYRTLTHFRRMSNKITERFFPLFESPMNNEWRVQFIQNACCYSVYRVQVKCTHLITFTKARDGKLQRREPTDEQLTATIEGNAQSKITNNRYSPEAAVVIAMTALVKMSDGVSVHEDRRRSSI